MTRIPTLTTLLLAFASTAAPAAAQDFPAPGTGAITWEVVGDRPIQFASMQFGADRLIYAGGLDSLYTLPLPSGEGLPTGRWQSLPGHIPLGISAVLPLDSAGDTLLIGSAGGGQLNRSTDHGATWTMVEGPSYVEGRSGGPRRPGGFFVIPPGRPRAGRVLAGGAFQYSDDRGATWTDADYPNPGDATEPGAFALMPSGRILAAGRWGVATTDDGGSSFQTTPVWGPFQFEGDGLAALATPGSTQSGAPACGQADVTRCDGAVLLSIEVPFDGVFAYRTNDGGRTWSERYPLPQPYDGIGYGETAGVVALPPGPGGLGRAVAVLGRGMVYRTMDGAQSWQPIGRLPLRTDGVDWAGYLLLGPDRHLWVMTRRAGPEPHEIYRSAERVDEVLAVAGEGGPETPPGVRLDVNPNPTSGRGTVRITVAEASAGASVMVYDALGRRVAALHDGPLGVGMHTFAFETAALAPGVYVVQARATSQGTSPWAEARRITIRR